jgi:hypothetical protein
MPALEQAGHGATARLLALSSSAPQFIDAVFLYLGQRRRPVFDRHRRTQVVKFT